MGRAIEELLARAATSDPYDYAMTDVRQLQLDAADERFQRSRSSVALLNGLAAEVGVNSIRSLADLVAVTFPHTAYKSYPDSWITEGEWHKLAEWLDVFSVGSVVGSVDLSDVRDLTDWSNRLHDAGHLVFASSGTSGIPSILNQEPADLRRLAPLVVAAMRWATGAQPHGARPVFILSPSVGSHNMLASYRAVASAFGRQDAVHWLNEEAMSFPDLYRLSDGSQVSGSRPKDGEDIRSRRLCTDFDRMAESIGDHRAEPSVILGFGPLHWRVVQRLQQRGIEGLHPGLAAQVNSQTKGLSPPIDYLDQISKTYGLPRDRFWGGYGMVEALSQFPRCAEGQFHLPPWVIPLVLDNGGDHLVSPRDGCLEGRFALLDLAIEGRWGAIASGDRVVMRIDCCPCGRRGATVVEATRLSEHEGGDERMASEDRIESQVRKLLGG
jgi:hypothetical protein